jgi:prevent-host-death family protein
MRSIPAGRFKAQCLALLDDVAATGETIVVTKRGKPVAQVIPLEPPDSLEGSVTYLVSDEELMAPIDAVWEAKAGRL